LYNAVIVKAGKAFLLSFEANTSVSTGMHFVTTSIHYLDALRLSTNIFKSWLHVRSRTLHLLRTESALTSHFVFLSFFTSLAQMVRLSSTESAEVLIACVAPNSVFTEVLS
jgi:hypothetical protein